MKTEDKLIIRVASWIVVIALAFPLGLCVIALGDWAFDDSSETPPAVLCDQLKRHIEYNDHWLATEDWMSRRPANEMPAYILCLHAEVQKSFDHWLGVKR